MATMTEEEALALDIVLTDTNPVVTVSNGGMLTRKRDRDLLDSLDSLAAGYIRSQSELNHQTASEVIGTLVRKQLTAVS